MGRLAIVIPSVGSVAALESTLLSVLENRPSRTEILVVYAHPYDDQYQLQGEVRLIQAPEKSSLVACANLGIQETSADIVHLLSTGCYVREGWTDSALKHFADPRVAVVAPLLMDAADSLRAIAAHVGYGVGGVRCEFPRATADVQTAGVAPILAASLAAVFYNRVTLSTAGYLSEEVGAELAGLDLGMLLDHAGFKTLIDPKSTVRVPRQQLEPASDFRNALCAERMFWRNAPLVGWFKSLAAHPLSVAVDALRLFPRPGMFAALAGRLAGAATFPSARQHHRRLDDLCSSAPLPANPTAGRQMRIDRPHESQTQRAASDTLARPNRATPSAKSG